MKTELTKLEAIEYVCKAEVTYTDEWVEAGLFHIINQIVNSSEEIITKDWLDKMINLTIGIRTK